jgi:predicted membrane-bound mannosyltransferase
MTFTETAKQTPQTRQQPIIRPGQRKPYRKATRKEVRQRLNAAAALEYWYHEKSEIHWFFQFVFGVESRQTDRYIARARIREGRQAGFSGGYSTSAY